MEKTISIRNTEITFSIWDLGGQREFVNMLPLVCNDAVAILFMFDLTRKSTLNSIKEWYRQSRGFNKTAIPFLIGTKYDHFVNFPRDEQEEISNQVGLSVPEVCVSADLPGQAFCQGNEGQPDIQQHQPQHQRAKGESCLVGPLSSPLTSQIFKIVLSKAFDLRCTIPEIEHVGEPLLLYQTMA